MTWRAAAVAGGLIGLSMGTASCIAQLSAPRILVQVTPLDRFVATPDHVSAGEVIVEIRNQSHASHLLEMVRLDRPTVKLPVAQSQVPDGGEAKPTFSGAGYKVVAKLDLLKAFLNGRDAPSQVIHQYLDPGTYVLFDNLPGRYSAGYHLTIQVS